MRGTPRRIARIAALAGVVLACAGCVDVLQYLSVNEAGESTMYLRFTLQKAVFAMAASMGGEAPDDLEGSLDEQFDLDEEEVLSQFPEGMDVRYEKIDTELEYGFTMSWALSGAMEAKVAEQAEAPPLVPVRKDGKITIVFPQEGSAEQAGGDEGEEFAQLFLSSAKYRVMVSKRVSPLLSAATFFTPDGEVTPEIVDLPEVYLVEIPMVSWLTAKGTCRLELR